MRKTCTPLLAKLFVLLVSIAVAQQGGAASYTVTVPAGGKFFAAYHFATADLEDVIPPGTVPWGTTVQIWNNSTQTYNTQTMDDLDENWLPSPGYDLTPGTVFFIDNYTGSDFNLTISGTEVSGSVSLTLVLGNWNGYASPKLPATMLECPCEFGSGMESPGVTGDVMYWWHPGDQEWHGSSRGATATTLDGFTWGGYCDGGIIGKAYDDGVGDPWETHVVGVHFSQSLAVTTDYGTIQVPFLRESVK